MTDRPGDAARGGRTARRPLMVLAVLAAVAGVIAVSRAGLPDHQDPATPAPTPAGTPLAGTVLGYAAGEARLYVLAESCAGTGCRLRLVTSGNEGRTWTEGTLPAGYPQDADAARDWRLTVAGPDDRLSIETADRIATSPDAGRSFAPLRITDGPPVERVPANQEAFARICPPPRCGPSAVEFVQPRTGVRSRLAHQPPVPPLAFGVEGFQLWSAGRDPRTGRWTVAASTDDGASWDAISLPVFADDPGLRARLLPVPGESQAFLVFSVPLDPSLDSVSGVWTVPDPAAGGTARQIRPESGLSQLDSAIASSDGRLLLTNRGISVLSPDGAVARAEGADGRPPLSLTSVGRGLRDQVAAVVLEDDPFARLALSATGSPDSWRVVRIRLPDG